MGINDRVENKNKSITFVSNTKQDEDQCDIEEIISDDIAHIGRKFNKALKILDRRQRTNVEDKVPDNFKNIGPQHKSKEEDKPKKEKGFNVMNVKV